MFLQFLLFLYTLKPTLLETIETPQLIFSKPLTHLIMKIFSFFFKTRLDEILAIYI